MEVGKPFIIFIIVCLNVYFICTTNGQNWCPLCDKFNCTKPKCSGNEILTAASPCQCCKRCYPILGEGDICLVQVLLIDAMPLFTLIGICDKKQNISCRRASNGFLSVYFTCQKNSPPRISLVTTSRRPN